MTGNDRKLRNTVNLRKAVEEKKTWGVGLRRAGL